MNQEIELHDSELAAISSLGDQIILSFEPAYIHRSLGRPGIDPGTGWTQDVTLTIRGVSAFSQVVLPATVSSGWLRIGDKLYENAMPAAGTFESPIEFSAVVFAQDFTVRSDINIRGSSLTVVLNGEPHYVEEFPPKSGVT